jgi:hypothetical protein
MESSRRDEAGDELSAASGPLAIGDPDVGAQS